MPWVDVYKRQGMIDAHFCLIERIYDYVEDISPRVVYGLLPPYYPDVYKRQSLASTDFRSIYASLGREVKRILWV